MGIKLLDLEGLKILWEEIKNKLNQKVDKTFGKTEANKRLCLDANGNICTKDEYPLADYQTPGLICPSASTELRSYHAPSPVVNGIPYHENHVYKSGDLTLNGASIDGASYVSDTVNDKVIITIPLRNEQPWRRIYNLYLYNMYTRTDAGPPWGFTHLTIIPATTAYPKTSDYRSWVNKSLTTAGGAVLVEGKYSVAGRLDTENLNEYILVITISGTQGWQNNLNYILVVD